MTCTLQARGLVWLVQSLVNMLNDAARLRVAWMGGKVWVDMLQNSIEFQILQPAEDEEEKKKAEEKKKKKDK